MPNVRFCWCVCEPATQLTHSGVGRTHWTELTDWWNQHNTGQVRRFGRHPLPGLELPRTRIALARKLLVADGCGWPRRALRVAM